jgi:anti-anti-sigma factor
MHLLTELADRVLQDRPLRLVLDLANLTFFCSSGVNALLHIRRAAYTDAVQLVVYKPSPITLKVLTAARATHLFQIKPGTDLDEYRYAKEVLRGPRDG